MTRFRVAAAQYPLDWLDDWDDYQGKLDYWVGSAAADGARLLVFPEYGAMELATLAGAAVAADLAASIEAVSARLSQAEAILTTLAARHGVHILAASAPVRRVDGRFVNVARMIGPGGVIGGQAKRVMTRFERDPWGIAAGEGLWLFDLGFVRVGVAICYDVEFPLMARALTEAGAEVILAPSCTETLAGSHRVHTGAKARALENQCYVVVSQTVGEARWSPAVEINCGLAAVYCPSDKGLPDDGVVASGARDEPMWVIADLDLARIAAVRADGTVLNLDHWPEQPRDEPVRLARG